MNRLVLMSRPRPCAQPAGPGRGGSPVPGHLPLIGALMQAEPIDDLVFYGFADG